MIVKGKAQGPILLIIVGIIGLCCFRQLFAIKNKGLLVLFVLNLGALLYLFVNVINTEVILTTVKPSDPRPLLALIRVTHFMMIGLCICLLLVMIMVARADKA
jgi:hypothetical protein